MKILIAASRGRSPSLVGAYELAVKAAQEMRSSGHEVVVYTSMPAIGVAQELGRWDEAGVPLVAMAATEAVSHRSHPHELGSADGFGRLLATLNPDVALFTSMSEFGLGPVETALDHGIPTVVSIVDAWWLCERGFMIRSTGQWCGQHRVEPTVCGTCVAEVGLQVRRLDRTRAVLNRCDRVLVATPYWLEVLRGAGVDESRLHLRGDRASRRTGESLPSAPPVGPLRIGYTGGTADEAGYRTVVDAFNSILRSDYELHLPAQSAGGYAARLEDYPVTGYVRIRDVPAEQYLRGVEVLLCPPNWPDPLGLVVEQALCHGIWPVVARDAAGSEYVEDGLTGSVIDLDGTCNPLAAVLNRLLQNPETVRGGNRRAEPLTFHWATEGHLLEVLAARGIH